MMPIQEVCSCGECRTLDRQHPAEGVQLALLGSSVDVTVPSTLTAAEIATLLRRTRMRVGTEMQLQQSIEDALTAAGVEFTREARLSAADRIDFLAGAIGIEAKVRYPKRSIYRQLERYAAHDTISALILVTGTAMGLPSQIGGKHAFYVSTGRASL